MVEFLAQFIGTGSTGRARITIRKKRGENKIIFREVKKDKKGKLFIRYKNRKTLVRNVGRGAVL